MTPDKQRIAIAAACGWVQTTEYNSVAGWHKMTNKIVDEFFCKYTYDDDKQPISCVYKATSELPNYLHDLNAMHEAERILDGYMMLKYASELLAVIGGGSGCFSHIHATAAQRAEAFLRTIGKWEGEQ